MKQYWMFSLVCSTMLLAVHTGFAEPKDKSQNTWLATKKKIDTEVDTELTARFKPRVDMLQKLKDRVFKVGDTVSVTRIVGGREFTVKGLFQGLQPKGDSYVAVISNTNYLLSDLDEQSALLLKYGGLPIEVDKSLKLSEQKAAIAAGRAQALDEYVQAEIERINAEKARLAEQSKNNLYAKAGYDSMFFETNVLIGDKYYSPADLGVTKMYLQVDIPRNRRIPCANFKLMVKCPFKGILILKLGDKVIGSTTLDYTNPESTDLKKVALEGYIMRKDLGASPAAVIASSQVHFICTDINTHWMTRAKGNTSSKSGRTHILERIRFSMLANTYKPVDNGTNVSMKLEVWNALSYQQAAQAAMKPFLKEMPEKAPAAPTPAPTPAPKKEAPAPAPAPAPEAPKKDAEPAPTK